MQIQPVGLTSSSFPSRRPRAAAAAGPLDQVQLSAAPTRPVNLSLAAQAVAAATQAAPAPTQAAPALADLRQMAERLQANGFKLRHRPKVLFWTLDMKPSNPDKFSRVLEKAPERVSLQFPGRDFNTELDNSDDLLLLDALYGKADVSQLSNPPLARALLQIEAKNPTGCSAYLCYLEGSKLSLMLDRDRATGPEQVIALAYLRGLVSSPEGLEKPDQAVSLRTLEEAGFSTDGSFAAYKRLSPHDQTTVHLGDQVLATFSEDQMGRTEEVMAELERMKSAFKALEQQVGKQAGPALDAARTLEGLDLDARLGLAARIFGGARYPAELLGAVAQSSDDRSQVDAWLRIGTRYDATLPDGHALSERMRALKLCTPKGETPSERLMARLDALALVAGDESAARCVVALESHPGQPAEPEKCYQALESTFGRRTSEAFTVLASHGRLAHDGPLLESMARATGRAGEAIAAYPTLRASVPPEHHELYLSLWKQAPQASMKEAWKAVFRPDSELTQARAAAWTEAVQSTRDADGFSRLLGELPDGPDLAWRADMLTRVVQGAQGNLKVASEVWKSFQESSDLETTARFYQATGDQQTAARAAEVLTREDLAGNFSFAERRDALSGLIGALKGDVAQGLSAYRHLLAVTGPDLRAASQDFSRLLEVCSDEEQARVAYGALRTSPPVPDSPTSAQSLALALELHQGDLSAARELWTALEMPDPSYPHSERAANLARTERRDLGAEQRTTLYRWMTSARLDETGREAVSLALGQSGDFEQKLAAIQLVAPRRATRPAMMKALASLGVRSDCLGMIAPHAGRADFQELTEAVKSLGNREAVERLLAAHTPGESYTTLATLLAEGSGQFDALRRSLAEGTPENQGLGRNTEWLVKQLGRHGDLSRAREAWEAVRRPVGAESTEERLLEFERLNGTAGSWRVLTSWMQPGETLAGAVDAALRLKQMMAKLVPGEGPYVQLLTRIREEQVHGTLESLTLGEVARRLEQDAAEAVLEKGALTVDGLMEGLTSHVGTQIEEGGKHVVIGGVRMATRSVPAG